MILEVLVRHGGGRDAVLPEDLRRAPLRQFRCVADRGSLTVAHEGVEVRVRMEVDEARCENETGTLDDRSTRASGLGGCAGGDFGDRPSCVDEHVGDLRVRARPVDHRGATDAKRSPRSLTVTHRSPSLHGNSPETAIGLYVSYLRGGTISAPARYGAFATAYKTSIKREEGEIGHEELPRP